jgi:hypothetical protein
VQEIELFAPGELPSGLAELGLRFIKRRFQEVWGIDRYDVTRGRIGARHNLIVRDGSKLAAWLGVEPDGEVSNACVEPGMGGVALLSRLLRYAVEQVQRPFLYAETPVEKLASATIFSACGFRVGDPPRMEILIYRERPILLVRLELPPGRRDCMAENSADAEEQLQEIRRLRDHVVQCIGNS